MEKGNKMTTALIIARDESGMFLGSYCNSDGYPSYVGRVLERRYNTNESVAALMALGDLSALGDHFADVPGGERNRHGERYDTTIAYCRDRREPFRRAFVSDTLVGCPFGNYDYAYLYTDGKWLCRVGRSGGKFVPVEEAVEIYERRR